MKPLLHISVVSLFLLLSCILLYMWYHSLSIFLLKNIWVISSLGNNDMEGFEQCNHKARCAFWCSNATLNQHIRGHLVSVPYSLSTLENPYNSIPRALRTPSNGEHSTSPSVTRHNSHWENILGTKTCFPAPSCMGELRPVRLWAHLSLGPGQPFRDFRSILPFSNLHRHLSFHLWY